MSGPTPEFSLGQEVGHEGEQWWITGVNMKCGYDGVLWEYSLGRGFYGPYPPWSGRTDVKVKYKVRPDQITTPEKLQREMLSKARAAVDKAQRELDRLRKQEQKLADESVSLAGE